MINNPFFRGIAVVLSGTVAAQSIPLLGSLIIARLYVPLEFGLFSAWLGAVMLAAVVITGRLEMTIAVVADGEPRKFAVTATLLTICAATSIFFVASILIYYFLDNKLSISPLMVWLFMPAAALSATMNTWQAWAAADGSYRKLSGIRITQAFSITALQICMGLLIPSAVGMMLGYVFGLLLGLAVAFFLMRLEKINDILLEHSTYSKLKEFWKLHRRFPIIALPADAINTAASQLPLIFIASRFGAEASGLFALTLRVLGAPISLLGAAVLDVFKRTAATSYRQVGQCRDIYLHTFWLLLLGAILMIVAVVIAADQLFLLAFGEPWKYAATISIWLLPMFAMRFIASPLSYVFYITGKQHIDLVWQCALLAMTVAAFIYPLNFEASVKFYSTGYSALYIVYTFLSYGYSKKR